jgi:hypothetical protein
MPGLAGQNPQLSGSEDSNGGGRRLSLIPAKAHAVPTAGTGANHHRKRLTYKKQRFYLRIKAS